MSAQYGGWVGTSQPSCNSFCLVMKETCVLCYSDERLCFLLDTFHQGLLSVGLLVGMNCLVFWKELIMKDSVLISPSQHLLWVKTGIWCGWWWFICLTHDIFHSILLYSIHFSSPVTICLKNRTLLLCFSRESHVEIWSRRLFLLNLCGTQTSKRLT